jgi:hypothetical protein
MKLAKKMFAPTEAISKTAKVIAIILDLFIEYIFLCKIQEGVELVIGITVYQ